MSRLMHLSALDSVFVQAFEYILSLAALADAAEFECIKYQLHVYPLIYDYHATPLAARLQSHAGLMHDRNFDLNRF